MSTRIYNGYKMKNLSMGDMVSFINELRNITQTDFYDFYCNCVVKRCCGLISALTRYNSEFDGSEEKIQKTEKLLKSWYFSGLSHERLYMEREIDIEKIIDKLSFPFVGGILNAVVNTFKTEHEWTEYFLYDLRSSIAFFENDKNSILFIPYGSNFIKVLSDTLSKNPDFTKKYSIIEYGYWNNTDHPEEITEEEWAEREKSWDRAFKNSLTAAQCALCTTDVYEPSNLYSIFSMASDGRNITINKMMPPIEEILLKEAENMTVDELCKNDQRYEPDQHSGKNYKIALEYHEKIQNNDEKLKEMVQDKANVLLRFITDTDEILSKNILDFLPNYIDYKKKHS